VADPLGPRVLLVLAVRARYLASGRVTEPSQLADHASLAREIVSACGLAAVAENGGQMVGGSQGAGQPGGARGLRCGGRVLLWFS
jgi:hypothetical protein